MSEVREKPGKGIPVRLIVRCCAAVLAVVLVLPVLPWPWTSLALPSLSVFVLICSTVATRTVGVATLIGLPVLLIVLVRRRWFCRHLCPVGLLTEYTGRLRPGRNRGKGETDSRDASQKSEEQRHGEGVTRRHGDMPNSPRRRVAASPRLRPSARGLPPIGRWVALLTLGGAIFGYPLFLWLDPLAIFHGVFTLWHDPANLAGKVSAVALGLILAVSLLIPHAWCLRICPLGAAQELLALPRRLLRHQALRVRRRPGWHALRFSEGRGSSVDVANPRPSKTLGVPPNRRLSRRAAFATGLGVVCVGLGARWATAAAKRASNNRTETLRPPGAIDEARFAGVCLRCGNCLRACPAGVIHADPGETGIAELLAPMLSFATDYCREDCRRCTLVCPSGALARLTLEEKQKAPIGVAKLEAPLCLLYDDRECDICAKACPYEAIKIVWDQEEYIALPQIQADKCPGCGACEVICPGTNDWEQENAAEPIPLRKAIRVSR